MSLRILHTVEYYAPSVGGAQEVVRQISERLARRGHDVTVATTKLPMRSHHEIGGVRIEEFAVSGNAVRGMVGEVDRYRDFVSDGGFDVVMSYAAQQWATDALLPLAGDLDPAMVLAPCGFSALDDPAYAEFFAQLPDQMRRWQRLVFHSSTYQDVRFARDHGLTNIDVVPNGADEREFGLPDDEIAERRRRFRAEHGVTDDDEPLLLTVGGHTGGKGHSLAIAALNRVSASRATLALVGNTPLGRGCLAGCRRRSVATRARSLGRRRVLLLDPPRDGVLDAYFAADLFVFGSRIECSPLVLFEAAAAGLPFVTVPVGNAAEIADWTGAGLVVDAQRRHGHVYGRSGDIAAAVDELIADPVRRRAMGAAGRQAWAERFSWDQLARRYEQIYREVVASRVGAGS
jgi:glycosyltransferase involved in cell wall biosynthesis